MDRPSKGGLHIATNGMNADIQLLYAPLSTCSTLARRFFQQGKLYTHIQLGDPITQDVWKAKDERGANCTIGQIGRELSKIEGGPACCE